MLRFFFFFCYSPWATKLPNVYCQSVSLPPKQLVRKQFDRSSAFVSVYSVVFSPQHSRSSYTFTDRCQREFFSWNCLQLKKCCYLTVRCKQFIWWYAQVGKQNHTSLVWGLRLCSILLAVQTVVYIICSCCWPIKKIFKKWWVYTSHINEWFNMISSLHAKPLLLN